MELRNPSNSFEVAYHQLNTEQQVAVNCIEGPVLVIAGPGTGKTQILAARIAYILLHTDSLPENILCLTYTEAGAVAMRQRLLQFIGPDAYRVNIYTFHAFCNLVIQENLDYFGVKGLDAVSELEQIAFVHEIIDEFDQHNPLKRYTGEVYFDTKRLLNLYQTMKRENWSAAFLKERTTAYLKDLPNREEYIYKRKSKHGNVGDVKQAEIDREQKTMSQLLAAANSFDDYNAKLAKAGRYDFDDMILWVLKAFGESEDLLRTYQERFHYFLVDEYQDTNGSQNNLLSMLIDYWENPNVFCVGDDDQSIFRFQGANIENIQQFVERYQPQIITLKSNYRSTQPILDASTALIKLNHNRIDASKILVAKNPTVAVIKEDPNLYRFDNTIHEVVGIAEAILALQKKGVALNEVAVLYRKHAQAEELMAYLQSKGIGINTRKKINILEEPFIQKVLQILRYIEAEQKKAHSGEPYLFELLHYDFFENDPLEISKISVEVYRKNFNERVTSWREELRKSGTKKAPDLFNPRTQGVSLVKTVHLLEDWIKASSNVTLLQLIELIIKQSGMIGSALTGVHKHFNMQLLHSLFDFVKDECSRHPKTTLSGLMRTLLLMEKEHVSIPVQKIVLAKDGVHFITAHSSKGLEFEYVFVIGATTKAWGKGNNHKQFKLPDTLFSLVHSSNKDHEVAENRRLFYVAMTRAKKQLVISFANQDLAEKNLEKSAFVAELENNAGLKIEPQQLTDEALFDFNLSTLSFTPTETKTSLFDNEFVDELLEKYSLSVTHLNNYLKCPTAFYFNNIIRVPAPLSEAMTFGSAVHHALEMLFKNMNAQTEKRFASVTQFVNDFKWYMRKNEEGFTPTAFKRRIEYGEQILTTYYEKYIHDWNKITSVERSYRNVVMNGVPLNGKLDKLEFEGNKVNVVDYKTGQFEKAKHKFDGPNLDKLESELHKQNAPLFEYEFGGDYWRQAVFYKILMDNDATRNWEMVSAEFDFVEPDKKTGEYSKQKLWINPSDISIVTNQIAETYANIKAKKFEPGCGKSECDWCNFVKGYYGGDNKLNLKPMSSDELDD